MAMIKTVEQGLEIYRLTYTRILRKMEKLKKKYDSHNWMMWSTEDYKWAISSDERLDAMADALKLTVREREKLKKEVQAKLGIQA